jgi:hypothetical protein
VPNEVSVLLTNEYRNTMSAYAQWENTSPTRIAEVGAGSSVYVRLPVRGQAMRIFFVPLGRVTGDPPDPGFIAARAGDSFQWTLRADLSVFHLRGI